MIADEAKAMELIRFQRIDELRGLHISKHFKWGEVFTNRSDEDIEQFFKVTHSLAAVRLSKQLEKIRTRLGGRSIEVTSWFRDVASNAAAGGSKLSRHLLGDAADIKVKGMTPQAVQADLKEWWPGGLGYGSTFTHVDLRPQRVRFGY